MAAKTQNLITFSLIGIAAYMFADILHEVVGHAGACLIQGHKIELLTSVYFRSSPGSIITDIGGPVSNLLFALLIYLILNQTKSLSLLSRLFLLNMMAYNLFWFSGTILQSSFSKTGDWAFAMTEINIGIFGKFILIIGSIVAYIFSIKLIKAQVTKFTSYFSEFQLKQSIYYSYFAAAIGAIIAGLFFKANRGHAAFEALLEMIASVPILFIIPANKVNPVTYETKSRYIFTIITCLLLIMFCLTLGRGYSF
jgi:hypothetical protein